MYLVTKWFGTFLCDEKGIKKHILFPKNEKEITDRLLKIKNNKILLEEKEISKQLIPIVTEKRLEQIGKYKPDDDFFRKIDIKPEEHGFEFYLLKKASVLVSDKKITKTLESLDLQIIQMINTFDDFIQTLNLFSERKASWEDIKASKQRMKPLENSFITIKKEMKALEKQIEKDMKKSAPNISNIIGPIIGARLISSAGSLNKLAMLPASTIQVLGAEKALFRFKKEGGKPPKHGYIFQHNYINKSPRNIRGKIARSLAAKISTAAKADVFTKRDISRELLEDLNQRLQEIRKR
jgi:RNA processing factor Prp31